MSQRGERRAVITGASRGIGYAVAADLLDRGYVAWLIDIDEEKLQSAKQRLATTGAVNTVVADVADQEQVNAAFREVEADGGAADLLVNNAGVMPQTHFLEVPAEEFRRVIRVNLDGVYWCSQRFARSLVDRGQGGAIVNVSSMAAFVAPPRTSAYCASKGGVSSLTRALAVDLGPFGIRVNEIAPGVILTDMNRHLFDGEGKHEGRALGRIPAGRIGTPEDLVGAVAFLASPEAEYVTGATLPIDGGYLAR